MTPVRGSATLLLIADIAAGVPVADVPLISRFGEKRAPMALGIAALLFGLPIFFDAGLVVFLPIIFSVAKRFGGGEIGASIGLTLLVGVVAAVVAWLVTGGRETDEGNPPAFAHVLGILLPCSRTSTTPGSGW